MSEREPMTTINPPEEDLHDVIRVTFGLVVQRLCVRNHITPEEAAKRFTRLDPPGTEFGAWVVRVDDDGESSPVERCETYPEQRYHLLLNC